MKQIKKFLLEEEGLTTVEYAIAGALVGAAVIASFRALGVQVTTEVAGITAELAK